ncbi:MAG: chitobiase/beta-hexosaminidase C-terminal domain-containing protein [Prevotella sp.]|nr:chitobiase/beta-hexosaminidase C-terminal domain-containing protein [Prevotella sp.]
MTRAMVDSTNGIEWIDIDSLLATDDENPTPTPTPSGSVAAPTISGTTPFETSTSVTMSGPTGAEIRYTTDGSTPTSSSSLYSSAITLSATTTVKAIAIKDGQSSEVTTKTFTKSGGGGDAD